MLITWPATPSESSTSTAAESVTHFSKALMQPNSTGVERVIITYMLLLRVVTIFRP